MIRIGPDGTVDNPPFLRTLVIRTLVALINFFHKVLHEERCIINTDGDHVFLDENKKGETAVFYINDSGKVSRVDMSSGKTFII